MASLSNLTSPEWADQTCQLLHKYLSFTDAYQLWDVSPRVVKGVIKHPLLMIALHAKHVRFSKEYEKDLSEARLQGYFEKWSSPKNLESLVKIHHIDQAIQCFKRGLTPMQYVQECFAEIEDGEELSLDEAASLYGASGTLLVKPMMIIALALVVIVGFLNLYKHAAQKYQGKVQIEMRISK